jgi:hypothetical protein
MTTTDTTSPIDAVHRPLVFAILALDMVDADAFALTPDEDRLEMEGLAETGGFELRFSLEGDLTLTLSHDEVQQEYMVSVGCLPAAQDTDKLRAALLLNQLMPVERRFALDPDNLALLLSERWPAASLALPQLASGIRLLLDIVQNFNMLEAQEALDASTSELSMAGFIRV